MPEKPLIAKQLELVIKGELLKHGVPEEMASAVPGYSPEQIPFIYRKEPSKTIDGNSGRPMESQLWIGTTDAIWNLDAEWKDQIPEVIVQWRGYRHTDKPNDPTRITRTEIHNLPDGLFVELEYEDVSAMGQFDGELERIEFYRPAANFSTGGRERKSFAIFGSGGKIDEAEAVEPYWSYKPEGKKRFITRQGQTVFGWEFSDDLDEVGRSSGKGQGSSTTILNGFQEFLNFDMGEVKEVKADSSKAFRYTPLPEPPKASLLEGESTELKVSNKSEIMESFFPRVSKMMRVLAPSVRDFLIKGRYQHETQQMIVDGVLQHPEKMGFVSGALLDLSRKKRFELAQVVVKNMKGGGFIKWLKEQKEESLELLINDTADINARHLLDWFATASSAKLNDWLAKAEGVIYAKAEGKKVELNDQFDRCFDGMCTSFVERYIEFAIQAYLGKTLQ